MAVKWPRPLWSQKPRRERRSAYQQGVNISQLSTKFRQSIQRFRSQRQRKMTPSPLPLSTERMRQRTYLLPELSYLTTRSGALPTVRDYYNSSPLESDLSNLSHRSPMPEGIHSRGLQLYSLKNAIQVRYPGNKPYRQVEYSPNFYKAGGLVVGSSNISRPRHLARGKEELSLLSYEASSPPRMKWTERVKSERLLEERRAVKALNRWNPEEYFDERVESPPEEHPEGSAEEVPEMTEDIGEVDQVE